MERLLWRFGGFDAYISVAKRKRRQADETRCQADRSGGPVAVARRLARPIVRPAEHAPARGEPGRRLLPRAQPDHVRYIGHDWQYGNYARYRANNDAQVAVAKCAQGDTAFTIPVLERELINNKFTLPARG